jgi:hypothetical protein
MTAVVRRLFPTTAMTHQNLDDIELRIEEFFEDNYERLKLEGGYSMTRESLESARLQVLLYWRRLRHVATQVSETEVKLSLPGQISPGRRRFGIEGVVDIVHEDDSGRTVMYDLKTHRRESILGNQELYAQQLNVYAHIWQELRGQRLDEQCVICTQLPEDLRDAARDRDADPRRFEALLARWDPLVPIRADRHSIDDTVRRFGEIVDHIENGDFAPRDVATLAAPAPGGRLAFARDICRNCDARFSCSAYRSWIRRSAGTGAAAFERQFADDLEDYGDDDERMQKRMA